ncbi:MAG: sugar phosphate isomerase/epimerase [Planctomycetia bacterium]|nr:sugar phosphate isomerase/epimerase [Planctomycetia bacterium]
MYVACSTLCFAQHPLDEALKTIREMNFTKADLAIHEDGPHLKPSDLTGDLTKIVQKLKATNVAFAAIHARFAALDGPEIRKQFRGVCRLARLLTVPVVSVLAAPKDGDVDADVARLQDWVEIAQTEGVILTVETNSTTLTAEPAGAIELCKRVPGLGLTLDPSYYIAGERGPVDFDKLYPYVRHVRLRDSASKPDAFQVRVGLGELEYGKLVTHLDRCRYDRALTVDVRAVPNDEYPVEPEVRKLKYLLESLV